MNRDNRNSKLLMGLGAAMMAGLLFSGCAQTVAPAPNIIQRASGETPAPPPPSGFLGNDYSLLTPPTAGSDQNAALRYINPKRELGQLQQDHDRPRHILGGRRFQGIRRRPAGAVQLYVHGPRYGPRQDFCQSSISRGRA